MMNVLTTATQMSVSSATVARPDMHTHADPAVSAQSMSRSGALPIPPGNSQSAAVTEARMNGKLRGISTTPPVDRVLKPYGIEMITGSFVDPAPTEKGASQKDVAANS